MPRAFLSRLQNKPMVFSGKPLSNFKKILLEDFAYLPISLRDSSCTNYVVIFLNIHQFQIRYKFLQAFTLKGGDWRVRIFSAHDNWWATPEVSLPLPHQRSAKIILIFLRQGVKTMYYFKNMHSKSLKCAK